MPSNGPHTPHTHHHPHSKLKTPGINMDTVASQHPEALEAAVAQTLIAERLGDLIVNALEHNPSRKATEIPPVLKEGLNGRDLESVAAADGLSKNEIVVTQKIAMNSVRHLKPHSP